jgi:hypothetical protein
MIRVFMHDGIAFPLREGAAVGELLLDGDIALTGGGITGIGNCGLRRAGRRSRLFHGASYHLKI